VGAQSTATDSMLSHEKSDSVEQIDFGTRVADASAEFIQVNAGLLAKLSEDLEQTANWFKTA